MGLIQKPLITKSRLYVCKVKKAYPLVELGVLDAVLDRASKVLLARCSAVAGGEGLGIRTRVG
jgi:hypothetical protein